MTCETLLVTVTESPRNAWRQTTPGTSGLGSTRRDQTTRTSTSWCRPTATPTSPRATSPITSRPSSATASHTSRFATTASQYSVTEGNRPMMIRPPDAVHGRRPRASARHFCQRLEPEDALRNATGRTIDERLARPGRGRRRHRADLPEQGTAVLGHARPRVRGRHVPRVESMGLRVPRRRQRLVRRPHPSACVASRRATSTAPSPRSRWAAEHDFVGLCLGNAPVYGPKVWGHIEYNDPAFEALWSLVEETGLPVTFHVSTGRDPRAVGGNGGAIINYVCHSMETTIEPLVQLITSGVFERHPRMQAGLVESGIGFVPWLLETMDYAYKAHHFWVRPVIPELPSEYFRRHCFATFQEDHVGVRHRRAVRPRRQPDVGQRLPAPRGVVAALGRIDRAADGWAHRRVEGQDPRRQRSPRLLAL